MRRTSLSPAAVVLLALAATPAARAQGIVLPEPRPGMRTAPIVPARVRIAAEVTERAARVHLDQTFSNPYDVPLEGTFLLALPDGGTVSELAFHMDGRRVKGELLDAERARAVYESIVRRVRDPALLEWAGRRLVRLSLFPVPPRGEARVEVVYAQVLAAEGGLTELHLPLRVPAGADAGAGAAEADVAVAVRLASEQPLGPIHSGSHPIDVSRRARGEARVTFEDRHARLDRDFLLAFAPAERGVGVELLAYRPAGEDGYFLLLVAPETAAAAERQAKDVVFVLDTSGSMRDEEKMARAARALASGLRGLDERDRFGLVTFATEARPWRERLVAATRANVDAAVSHLAGIDATGGTAIAEALDAGLTLSRSGGAPGEDRPSYLVFLTDGLPTIGDTEPRDIVGRLERAGPRTRVFTFGFGYDVNAALLDELAAVGRGRAQRVRPEEDLEARVKGFFERLNHPVATGLELRIEGVEANDLYPRELPDLFAGDDLIVAGRYRGQGEASVRLSGRLRGQTWSTSRRVRLPERADDKPHVATIWAERKVGFLLESIRLHGESAELRDEVVRIARAHGLVTPYTSYLVAEEEPRMANAPRPRAERPSPGENAILGRDAARGMAPPGPPSPAAAGDLRLDAAAGTADSFHASEQLSRLKEAKTAARSVGVRVVLGKRFTLRAGVWTDDAYRAGETPVERIAAFSQRYFELLARYPVLGDFFALGEQVVVVFERVAYRVEAGD